MVGDSLQGWRGCDDLLLLLRRFRERLRELAQGYLGNSFSFSVGEKFFED
jgi:hypothetical protein